jgi:hypothetical protein
MACWLRIWSLGFGAPGAALLVMLAQAYAHEEVQLRTTGMSVLAIDRFRRGISDIRHGRPACESASISPVGDKADAALYEGTR